MMDLKCGDSTILHSCRTILILILSGVFLPVSGTITLFAIALQTLHIRQAPRRHVRNIGGSQPRILVTGVKMAKGLFLARTMYLGGCDIVAGDFDDGHGNIYCGRFSRSIRKFFALKNPAVYGIEAYISQVVNIVNFERIDLWISCSGVATAVEDAMLANAIERKTKCKVFQFDESTVSTLDNKFEFMKKTTELKLANVKWYALSSLNGIRILLKKMRKTTKDELDVRYMIKSANMDDASRGSLPLISLQDEAHAEQTLSNLDFSNGRQWILQEFIDSGEEYCTHALIIKGEVRAFTACPSASVLMHYQRLDTKSVLYNKMLEFTINYASGLGDITGHMSFDFLVRYRSTENGFIGTLAPIECNPRCHTATVLFEGLEQELADKYLECLTRVPAGQLLHATTESESGYYWMAHDLVVLVAGSLWGLLFGTADVNRSSLVQQILLAIRNLCTWRDPTFVWWDPLPWFVLNHLFWPLELILATYCGLRWKEINVSTAKIFKA
ncbi:hypothetical protein EJ05DRAFT_472659 [Pseudovirgaria hyperparasitica]|uniref:ATP-grasp domain-containing protein n=1 Tax=Pseudovirgaria hyperparasitica TaxID=470096 RepID=A0A6A6WHI3_9PEZI|nr:uncharacterized protein EJ05DRAFT_472659 [Pseudovirgaria hyperparasitica]KAF2761689.1 hypothetical protein EJ05DRAFT_472659 [Pseudovirgaria hyperparasitica]